VGGVLSPYPLSLPLSPHVRGGRRGERGIGEKEEEIEMGRGEGG